MPLLTDQQIQELRKIIQDASTALAIGTFGKEATDDQIKELINLGYLPSELEDTIDTAYKNGVLLAKIKEFKEISEVKNMTYEEFYDYLKQNPVKLSDAEQRAYELAKGRAGQYCVGLGDRYSANLGQYIVKNDYALKLNTEEAIREKTSEAIAKRKTVGQLRSDLKQLTKDYGRDWERIAHTEIHQAHQEGYMETSVRRYGQSAMMAKTLDPGACDKCRELLTEDGTKPIVEPISWWLNNGTDNVGRKQSEWKAVYGAIHPFCRCTNQVVPEGMGIDDEGVLYVLEEEDVEKALYIGPRGGKWADPQHTIPYQEKKPKTTRKRKSDSKFKNIEVSDFVTAGTPRAHDVLGANFENVSCVRCGSRISNVFVTNHGPIGGDCLATVTGDNSTRVLASKLTKKLEYYMARGGIRVLELHIEPPSGLSGGKSSLVAIAKTDQSYINEVTGEYNNLERHFLGSFKDNQATMVSGVMGHIAEERGLKFKDLRLTKSLQPRLTLSKGRRKLHNRYTFQGLPISVENRKGSKRHWYDSHNNESGTTTMLFDYGYVRSSKASDGEFVDCYIGPNKESSKVFVIHQMKAPDFKKYDEDKVMLGFDTEKKAREAYLAHYNDKRFLGSVTAMGIEEFKKKVFDTKDKPGIIKSVKRGTHPLSGLSYQQAAWDGSTGSGAFMVHTGKDRPEKEDKKDSEHSKHKNIWKEWYEETYKDRHDIKRPRLTLNIKKLNPLIGDKTTPVPSVQKPNKQIQEEIKDARSDNVKENKRQTKDDIEIASKERKDAKESLEWKHELGGGR